MCDDDDRDIEAVLSGVISRMDRFVADRPLEAILEPYRNSFMPEMSYPAVVLNSFFAEEPGGGHGSAYLEELFRICDEEFLTVYTDAEGPRSRDFYLARGFEVTEGRRDHQLVRWAPLPPELAEEMGLEL